MYFTYVCICATCAHSLYLQMDNSGPFSNRATFPADVDAVFLYMTDPTEVNGPAGRRVELKQLRELCGLLGYARPCA